ncbi:hypothetical protein D3C76_428770 [compost metagenome]
MLVKGVQRGIEFFVGSNDQAGLDAGCFSDCADVHALARVGRLHTRLSVVLIVDDDDGQVLRILACHCRE